MEDNHRIAGMSITPTVPRQTPQNDFGTVLARTATQVINNGAGIIGGMLPGGALTSAAVANGRSAVSAVAASAAGVTAVAGASTGGTAAAASGTTGTSGKGDQWDLLEAQKAMQSDSQQFNAAYLELQNAMQKESREQNAISNIMKVRHDSAKAAINNIR